MKYSPREIRSLSDKKRHAIIGDIAREVRSKRNTIKILHKVHPLNMTEEEVQRKCSLRFRISQHRLQKQIITGFSFCIPESKQSTRIELLKSVVNLR